jgi:hypothetical protein
MVIKTLLLLVVTHPKLHKTNHHKTNLAIPLILVANNLQIVVVAQTLQTLIVPQIIQVMEVNLKSYLLMAAPF